jgi:hypothetical protein
VEIAQDGVDDALGRAVLIDAGPGRRRLVEAEENVGDVIEQWGVDLAPLQQRAQHALLRQPPHLNGVIDDLRNVGGLLGRREANVPVGAADDGDHTQIDVAGEAPVEADLFLAEVPALGKGRVVEVAQVHGPLDLVDAIPR